jgi:hypothetical protein
LLFAKKIKFFISIPHNHLAISVNRKIDDFRTKRASLCKGWRDNFFFVEVKRKTENGIQKTKFGGKIMATKAQIIANQRNAQNSTGPRSPEGKAVVSQNAVTHGLTAAHNIISSESQADFDLYRDQFLTELAPAGPMESMLAERVVNLSWRLKRSSLIQNQTIDALSTPDTSSPQSKLAHSMLSRVRAQSQAPPTESASDLPLGRLAVKDFSNTRVLERLLMYERRIENSLYKTILELHRLNLIKKLNPEYEMLLKQLKT